MEGQYGTGGAGLRQSFGGRGRSGQRLIFAPSAKPEVAAPVRFIRRDSPSL